MKKKWRAFPVFLLPMVTTAYETMYEKTRVDKIELKEIPGRIAFGSDHQEPIFPR